MKSWIDFGDYIGARFRRNRVDIRVPNRVGIRGRQPGVWLLHVRLLADDFLQLSQLLLDDAGDFFSAAFGFKIGIFEQFAFSLFSGTFCVVKIAFDLLFCTVCHFFLVRGLISTQGTK